MARQSRVSTQPAPTLGWSSRKSVAVEESRKGTQALRLINLFPRGTHVESRKGYSQHCEIEDNGITLMGYNGSQKRLFCSTSDSIIEVTTSTPSTVVTGLESGKMSFTNLTNESGVYLYCVNGIDELKRYDGTTWIDLGLTTTPAMTGIDTGLLNFVTTAKERLWFVEKDSTRAWYLPAGELFGELKDFDVGLSFPNGGKLLAIGSWSVTGGVTPEDLVVFISTEGDIAIYSGFNPADATDWQLVGKYNFGKPITSNCLYRLGTDLVILTKQGAVSLQQGQLFASASRQQSALSNEISEDITNAVKQYGYLDGWKITVFPEQSMIIINSPRPNGKTRQYVANSETGKWCSFTGINALDILYHNETIYFIDGVNIREFGKNATDNGSNIICEALMGFSRFQYNGDKQFLMARVNYSYSGNCKLSLAIQTNYNDNKYLSTPSALIANEAIWDESNWNETLWAGESVNNQWQNIGGFGFAGALHLKFSVNGQMTWSSTDIMFSYGRVL